MPSVPSPEEKEEDNQPEDTTDVASVLSETGTQSPAAENPVSESAFVDGTSMMPNWHNEKNQGVATSDVGGTSMMPKWHNGMCQSGITNTRE